MATATQRRFVWAAVGLAGLMAGCSYSPKVWVERTDTLTIPAANVQSLHIVTHNGGVELQGEEGRSEIAVTARVRGGGRNHESAQACLDALELVSETAAEGQHRLGSRWETVRQSDWQEGVSFKILAPANIALNVETHNGGLDVDRVQADCRLVTHNGGVKATHVGGRLDVLSHNGGITASTTGSAVDLQTHNGTVHLDATECAQLGGQIVSHNGGVKLEVGAKTSATLNCETANGGVDTSADLKNVKSSRNRLSGQLGDGGPELIVRTHNGTIHVNQK